MRLISATRDTRRRWIALINNGFTLLGLDPVYQQIVQGAIILTAVALDGWYRVRR